MARREVVEVRESRREGGDQYSSQARETYARRIRNLQLLQTVPLPRVTAWLMTWRSAREGGRGS